MTSKLAVLCDACSNLKRNGFSCPAYPDRIPDEIRTWGEDHRTVREDQTGTTVFELGDTDEQAQVYDQWAREHLH